MSILDDIGRFGTALRTARRNRLAVRELNALPFALQKDIGWPANHDSRDAAAGTRAYLMSLR